MIGNQRVRISDLHLSAPLDAWRERTIVARYFTPGGGGTNQTSSPIRCFQFPPVLVAIDCKANMQKYRKKNKLSKQ